MKKKNWHNKDKIISEVLEPLFKLGLSITKASRYAGIPQRTLHSWVEKDITLRLKIQIWQSEVSLVARKNITEKIMSGDIQTSVWWLKLKERDEFGDKIEAVQSSISYEELVSLQRENIKIADEIEESQKPKQGLYKLIISSKEHSIVV